MALEFVAPDKKLPNGKWMFKNQIELHDLTTGRVVRKFGEQKLYAPMSWVRFSPDGKTLYAISAINLKTGKSTVSRFDSATGVLKSQMNIDGMYYASPLVWDGKTRIATGNKIWDLKKGLQWHTKTKTLGTIFGFVPDSETVLAVPRPAHQGLDARCAGAAFLTPYVP